MVQIACYDCSKLTKSNWFIGHVFKFGTTITLPKASKPSNGNGNVIILAGPIGTQIIWLYVI